MARSGHIRSYLTDMRLLAIGALVFTVFVFWDMVSETARFGSGASGLITLASLSDEHTYNPFSRDASFISPDTAEWLLTEFDWPFAEIQQPTVCGRPQGYLNQVIAARLLNEEWASHDARMMRLLRNFVERGFSLEERYCGLTPLLSAILFADLEIIQFLIDAGADAKAEVVAPGRNSDGLNSLAFAHLLNSKEPERYAAVVALLIRADND